MPEEYTKTRDEIARRCRVQEQSGETPKGKEKDESCMQYAKRLAAAIYAKRHGVSPQKAEATVQLIEDIERMLGLNEDETS
jgi:hypothetical protein